MSQKLLRFLCRRCRWRKGRLFMVLNPTGFPTDLCLDCSVKDRIDQERYANERNTDHLETQE